METPKKKLILKLKHLPTISSKLKEKKKKFTYFIIPGNNEELIEKVLETRSEFFEKCSNDFSKYADFIWAPLSINLNYSNAEEKFQYLNHFEYNSQISNKMKLFVNLLLYCEKKNYDLFEFFPMTIIFNFDNNKNFEKQIEGFKFLFENTENFVEKKINKKYIEIFNVLYSKFIGSVQNVEIPKTFWNKKNLWIIKPTNYNRGRFIFISDDCEKIIKDFNESFLFYENIKKNKKENRKKNNEENKNNNNNNSIK